MKPEKLVLSGWGPYKNRIEVDFTKLEDRGLFLVTGPTGAGKTTLFDAISYALYGNMSGEIREKNSVRSDFAEAETPTFVELRMQHKGKEYRIERNPEYMRPKKKKGGKNDYTKEKEQARLYLPEDGGIIEGVGEVNRKIQEILVLDYRQFKQISMIAQGEFARLLTAPPSEKTKIFREIFSTSVYDCFASILRSRSNELYKQVMEYRHRMEEEVHMLQMEESEQAAEKENPKGKTLDKGNLNGRNLNEESLNEGNLNFEEILLWLEERITQDKKEYAEAEKNHASLEKEVLKLSERITQAEEINARLERLEALKAQKAELTGKKKEIRQAEKELKSAREADALKEPYLHLKHAGSVLEDMQSRKQKGEEELQALLKKEKELRPYYEKQAQIREGYEAVTGYEESRKGREEADRALNKKQEELAVLQKRYLEQEKTAGEKKLAYEMADLSYKRAVVGIAARQVKEGEPCPVCGSLEHPHVAETGSGVPEEAGLRNLQQDYEKEQAKLMEIHGKAAACNAEVAVCEEKKKEWADKEAAYRQRKENLPKEVCRIQESMSVKDYEKRLTEYHGILAQQKEKSNRLVKDGEEIAAQEKKKEELAEAFSMQYRQAGFASMKKYEGALRQPKEMERLECRVQEFYEKWQELEHLAAHLKEETRGKKKTDTAGQKAELEEKKQQKQQALKWLNERSHSLKQAKKIAKSLREREKKYRELQQEYGIVKDLDNMACGNNGKRLVFEQYVLAGYFEEILRAANIRLAKMTGGRYELSRLEGISDGRTKDNLELRVLDYYTGKYRSVKTLSGGESFKASLALALGMSDVVQGYSGGIRVDTLFIDEGFGALDGESLEQACQTLMSLVEKDRLIGIISHVPELSEKIEKQIIVSKTNVGSDVRIVV